jgi:hypothetical protein
VPVTNKTDSAPQTPEDGAGGKAKRKRVHTKYEVSPEKFIHAWMTSTYLDEVADKLGMPKDIVAARASNYRGMKLPLKKLKRRSKKALNVQALTELIQQYEREGAPKAPPPGSKPPRMQPDEVKRVYEETMKRLKGK